MNPTLVIRFLVTDPNSNDSFTKRLTDLCDVQYASGYRLITMFPLGMDFMLVFQLP